MRAMGKPAVIGSQDITIDVKAQQIKSRDGKLTLSRGDIITIDGSTGIVYAGEMPTVTPIFTEEFQTILRWTDKYKRMQVFANADSADDVRRAIELGAEGIGLCRTEHMFFRPERINLFRQLILTESPEDRKTCLEKIKSMQQEDFLEIFRAAENHEVIIRLLDSPKHEFLPDPDQPDYDGQIEHLAEVLQWETRQCREVIRRMKETNPMLGCRGCRQAIVNPDIVRMQTEAIVGKEYIHLYQNAHLILSS